MFEKIKNYQNNPYLKQLKDIRTLGMVAFAVVTVLVTWSGVQVVQTNYELRQQIVELEQENEVRRLENANMRLRNEYYNTDHFLELAARRQFAKAAPGETLIIVPKEVALGYAAETPQELQEDTDSRQPEHKSKYQENFEAWMNFFLNRNRPDS